MSMASPAARIAGNAAEKPRAAYVHVPFCYHKCGYCDFASVAGKDHLAADYLDALEGEIRRVLDHPIQVETVFIGGGTPTYLPHELLERLLTIVDAWFDRPATAEFTVESNPNTLDAAKVDILADHRVTRVSLGAQSFKPALLAQLERHHDPASVGRAVELVRKRIGQVSIDLIFGVPGQTLDDWKSDLAEAIAMSTDHLSTYGLTYEKGTPLWRQRKLGVVTPVDEEAERSMYEHAMERLDLAGYEQYEISNFALRRDDEPAPRYCRHNLVYWANDACHGFGTGAAAYVEGERTLNIRDVEHYIDRIREGHSVVMQSERLTPEERARETAMLNLRRFAGLDRAAFQAKTGYSVDDLAGQAIADFVSQGLLADDGARVRLTREGAFLADGILQAVL